MAVSQIQTIIFVVVFIVIILWFIFIQKLLSHLQNYFPKVAHQYKLEKGNILTISMWHPIRQLYLKMVLLVSLFTNRLMLDSNSKSYIWILRILMIVIIIGFISLAITS